ncbi:MAG: helix-turn-helix domain-containing protein [Verrucomicrobiales bacterium]
MEFRLIRRALDQTNGNRTDAAKLLGISRRTMQRKVKEMEDLERGGVAEAT